MPLKYEGREIDPRQIEPRELGHDLSRLRQANQDFFTRILGATPRPTAETMREFYDYWADGDLVFRDKLVAAMRPFLYI